MKLELSRRIFEKWSDIKFHENPSSESRVVKHIRRGGETEGQIGRHKETNVAFLSFANATENYIMLLVYYYCSGFYKVLQHTGLEIQRD
jgi:hypothetical protein